MPLRHAGAASKQFGFDMPRALASRGFTLIEMLAVLLVMGLLAGLASAIVRPDEHAQLRIESERLAQLLDLAATEAHLSGKTLAWGADGKSYRFWMREKDGWTELRNHGSLHARDLPQGMAISSLALENRRTQDGMRLEFTAHGAAAVFSLELSLGDERYAIESSPLGEVRVVPVKGRPHGEAAPS